MTNDRPREAVEASLSGSLPAGAEFRQGMPGLSHYSDDLPQTQMVGENEGTLTMKRTEGYVIHTPDGVWVEQK